MTVKATNEPWRELLDRVLSPKGFTYATKDGIVVIKKKDQKTRVLEGRVVDDMGGELPGVTVLILGKERNIGTMTDADGAFHWDSLTETLRFVFLLWVCNLWKYIQVS